MPKRNGDDRRAAPAPTSLPPVRDHSSCQGSSRVGTMLDAISCPCSSFKGPPLPRGPCPVLLSLQGSLAVGLMTPSREAAFKTAWPPVLPCASCGRHMAFRAVKNISKRPSVCSCRTHVPSGLRQRALKLDCLFWQYDNPVSAPRVSNWNANNLLWKMFSNQDPGTRLARQKLKSCITQEPRAWGTWGHTKPAPQNPVICTAPELLLGSAKAVHVPSLALLSHSKGTRCFSLVTPTAILWLNTQANLYIFSRNRETVHLGRSPWPPPPPLLQQSPWFSQKFELKAGSANYSNTKHMEILELFAFCFLDPSQKHRYRIRQLWPPRS